jgi:hypothetical protein
LVPLIAVVATTTHPVAVARVLLRQQQARTRTVTSAADDPYPDNDDDDDDDELLTVAVPVIVDDEAAYYPLPPPPPSTNIDEAPQFLLLLPRGAGGTVSQGPAHRHLPGCMPPVQSHSHRAPEDEQDVDDDGEQRLLETCTGGPRHPPERLPDDAHFGRGRGPTKEEKITTLVHGASHVVTTKDELSYSEAVAYLDMADGDVDRAITNVREDFRWSAEEGKIETVIAGTSGTSSLLRIIAAGRGDRHCRGLTHSEVRAYLEMADWDVDVALGSIREDFGTL